MSLWTPIEGREDSDLLGAIDPDAIVTYVEQAIEGLEGLTRAEWISDSFRYAFVLRVLFYAGERAKYAAVHFDADATVRELRASVDQMLERIQEELDKESVSSDTEIHTSPKPGVYAPSTWADMLAERALGS